MKKNKLLVILVFLLLLSSLSGCSGFQTEESKNVIKFTDSCGRIVELPKDITRVAPSGSVATMILATIAPEYLVSVSSSPSSSQYQYLPKQLLELPTTGQLYGSKSTINLEALLDAKPQVLIDLGDAKDSMKADMNALQKQTGIPTIFIQADLAHMAEAYRTLGSILSGKTEKGEAMASFIDETIHMAKDNALKIKEKPQLSVMYTTGSSGLNTNAAGSVQAQVLDLMGIKNAVAIKDVSNKGGGNTINMEQLYLFAPDVILFTTGSVYATVQNNPTWKELKAIRDGTYYEIPGQPYNWMSNPPSINMVLGVWWMGNLLYPDIYDYDMTKKAQEIYRLFWNYELTDEQAAEMLKNSTLKRASKGDWQ